jgi:ElaB/YqjD/DUF883 family membrane-anchored ribosome-binding protein
MQHDATNRPPAAAAPATASQPAAGESESDFLRRQADDAQRAIADTLTRMQQSFKDSADVQAWTRKYPWPSLGVAAAVGFLAARALAPRPSRAEIRQRAALDESFDDTDDDADDARTARRAKRRGRSAIRKLVAPLFEMLVGALQSSIVAAATAHFQQPTQEPSANGHEPSQGEE